MRMEEYYISNVSDWATNHEVVVHNPREDEARILFPLRDEPPSLFFIATVATPNDLFPPYLDTRMVVDGPEWQVREPHDDESYFLSEDRRIVIINHPSVGNWHISARGEIVPFSLNVMSFHPAIPPNSPPSPGPSGGSPFKCKACKSTAKALALSIVAAATLPVLPHALLAAVAAYLGASIVVAATFISSLLGDTATEISKKLCKKVGLC